MWSTLCGTVLAVMLVIANAPTRVEAVRFLMASRDVVDPETADLLEKYAVTVRMHVCTFLWLYVHLRTPLLDRGVC